MDDSANGLPLDPDGVTHAFARTARAVGLSGVRFHDLRHTHTTLMLAQGIHPKIVSERLGHSSITITLDTYSHVLPGPSGSRRAGLRRWPETARSGCGGYGVIRRLCKMVANRCQA